MSSKKEMKKEAKKFKPTTKTMCDARLPHPSLEQIRLPVFLIPPSNTHRYRNFRTYFGRPKSLTKPFRPWYDYRRHPYYLGCGRTRYVSNQRHVWRVWHDPKAKNEANDEKANGANTEVFEGTYAEMRSMLNTINQIGAHVVVATNE